jgi:hypothetical protein
VHVGKIVQLPAHVSDVHCAGGGVGVGKPAHGSAHAPQVPLDASKLAMAHHETTPRMAP